MILLVKVPTKKSQLFSRLFALKGPLLNVGVAVHSETRTGFAGKHARAIFRAALADARKRVISPTAVSVRLQGSEASECRASGGKGRKKPSPGVSGKVRKGKALPERICFGKRNFLRCQLKVGAGGSLEKPMHTCILGLHAAIFEPPALAVSLHQTSKVVPW
ncbi:hypothetical protein TYRP_020079 [Tyrophagus putrescentiae]|nr:hypothetical protein TYRP_020079 [Tyrophagus putrescentiae]